MFTYGVGGDQIRVKGRIDIELALIRWPKTPFAIINNNFIKCKYVDIVFCAASEWSEISNNDGLS